MSRKTDLEKHVRESVQLVSEYEQILRLSDNPKEKARTELAIKEQRKLLDQFTVEYIILCKRLGLPLPPDIAEIAGDIQLEDIQQFQALPFPVTHRLPSVAPTTLIPDMYALFIGIGAYQYLNRLGKTTNDAKDIYELFLHNSYSLVNLVLLLDEQATKPAINNQLDHLTRKMTSDSTFVLFFAGHGVQRVGGFAPGEYLCPIEADLDNLQTTGISNEELSTALRHISAKRIIVFLDACHSGGIGQPRSAGLTIKPGLSDTAYAKLVQGEGQVIIASCKPDQVSWELGGMRNGLFTHYLLKGLQGEAAGKDGIIGITDLYSYISKQVPNHIPQQEPMLKGVLGSNFPILFPLNVKSEPNQPSAGERRGPSPAASSSVNENSTYVKSPARPEDIQVLFSHTIAVDISRQDRKAQIGRIELKNTGEEVIPAGWTAKIVFWRPIDYRVTVLDSIVMPTILPDKTKQIGPITVEIPYDICQSHDKWNVELYVVDEQDHEKLLWRSSSFLFM